MSIVVLPILIRPSIIGLAPVAAKAEVSAGFADPQNATGTTDAQDRPCAPNAEDAAGASDAQDRPCAPNAEDRAYTRNAPDTPDTGDAFDAVSAGVPGARVRAVQQPPNQMAIALDHVTT